MAEKVINGKSQSVSPTKRLALGAVRICLVIKTIWPYVEPWLLG